MVFPKKILHSYIHLPQISPIFVYKRRHGDLKKKREKREVPPELSSKKKHKSSMSLVSQGEDPSKNKELYLRPYFIPKLKT
jgi:hypothetical protein